MRRGVGRQESVAMELIIVFGPPAVGKMTVGREICGLTGYKLFHNHLTVEPIVGGDRLPAHDLLDQHDYVRIDNTSLEPGEVALQVVEQLGLATI